MKKLLFLFFLSFSVAVFAQSPKSEKGPAGQIKLVCKIVSAPSNAEFIKLYEQIGLAYKEVARGQRQADSSYVLTVPAGRARLYSIGFSETMNGRIILGEEKQLTLYANAQFMDKARTMGSPANKAYENVRKQIENLRATSEQLRNEYRQARYTRDDAGLKTADQRLAAHNNEKQRFLDSLKTANPMFWRSASWMLSPDYHSGQSGYKDELDFYSKEFFRFAQPDAPGTEETPEVFDAFQSYVQTLSQLGANAPTSKAMVDAQLAKLKPGTNAYRRAYSGVVSGMKTANHPDFAVYAKNYADTYRSNDLGDVAALDFELKKTSTFTPGMEVPDIVGNTPEGTPFSLSKLRGKYVLIDFWASWCGPCRRENPNVVAMYNKYKGKGFDILGVSLDREATAWKNAIEKDGLTWHHVSDLKGWGSEHAKLYSVSSIPQTLLIDREGKIIQRNLRGEQLGEKLREIFGE